MVNILPESRETVRRVYAILDRLAADLRIAFTLRFVERHSLAEVAALTGCSLATAKRRISRATQRFAQLSPVPVDRYMSRWTVSLAMR